MADTKVKEKVELTPEQKEANRLKRMQDDLIMMQIGLAQKDENKRDKVFSRLKGKLTPKFAEECIANGDLTAKQVETLKTFKLIGETRIGVGKSAIKRAWRWQIGAEEKSPTGEALIALDTSFAKFLADNKANIDVACKWLKDNKEGNGDYSFATYFSKANRGKENAKSEANSK